MKRLSFAVLLAACSANQDPIAPPIQPPASASAPTEPVATATSTPTATASATQAPSGPPALTTKSIPLPGATPPAQLDLIGIERDKGRVWIPVSSTGSVDVFDIAKGAFTRVEGFKTGTRPKDEKKKLGPNAVAIGEGVAYVGNRASNEICAVDLASLKLGACVKVPGTETDFVAYVASAKQVWVTTPEEKTIVVLDAAKPAAPKITASIKLEGEPEGVAIDDAHGVFYTNLEDKDRTLAIDIKTRKVKSTWKPDCGEDGPKGLAVDGAHGLLFVACPNHVKALDATHDGAQIAKLDAGDGVDNIDWLESKRLLFIAAREAGKVTVARADEKGQLSVVATGDTSKSARNAVADANGNAYVVDAKSATMLVVSAP